MIKKYRKKPITIEAIQWSGKNLSEIDDFMGETVENKGTTLVIHTLEGDMEIAIKIDDNDLGSEPIVVKSTVYEQLYIVKS